MESAVEKLKHVGLTEHEAKAYLALLNTHLSTATQTAEKSGVPRTKIYSVLESLCGKGWVRIYSGVPLLFKSLEPVSVFEKIKDRIITVNQEDTTGEWLVRQFHVGTNPRR